MKNKKILLSVKIISAIILFVAAYLVNRNFGSKYDSFATEKSISQLIEIILMFAGLLVLVPYKKSGALQSQRKKFDGRALMILAGAVLIIPATIVLGLKFLGDTKHYIISSLVIAESLILCFISFEKNQLSTRRLVVISVMCALAVVGRIIFATIPQFKPMAAVIIISGVAFGGGTGFLVGSVSAFVSNFYFSQGSWTLWQMLGFGIIGYLSGLLTGIGVLKKNKIQLSIFGFLAIVLIYDGINILQMFMYMSDVKAVFDMWVVGIPMGAVHGASTVLFVWFIGMPLLESMERVKLKYGV